MTRFQASLIAATLTIGLIAAGSLVSAAPSSTKPGTAAGKAAPRGGAPAAQHTGPRCERPGHGSQHDRYRGAQRLHHRHEDRRRPARQGRRRAHRAGLDEQDDVLLHRLRLSEGGQGEARRHAAGQRKGLADPGLEDVRAARRARQHRRSAEAASSSSRATMPASFSPRVLPAASRPSSTR